MNIAGTILPADWSVFTRVSVLAVILCVIAGIVLVVPALFDHVRRWRANRRMENEMQTIAKSSHQSVVSPRAGQFVKTENPNKSPLGWSPEGDEDGSPIPQERKKEKRPLADHGEKTILVADDDPVVVHALSRRLEHLGYRVFRSPDASHALMGAMKFLPDLVILDVMMPGGNGLAVCEMMASDPRFSGIPVIIHSVIAEETLKERCRRLGAHYVEKTPQSWEEIKTLAEKLIGGDIRPAAVEQPSQPPCCDKDAVPVFKFPKEETPPMQQEAGTAEVVEKPLVAEKPDTAIKPDVVPAPSSPSASTPPMCGRTKVLCIESPNDRLEYVDHQLSAIGMEVARTNDLDQGYWACFTEKPLVVIIQCADNRKRLLDLLKRLTDHPVTKSIPVLVINEGKLLADHEMLLTPNVQVLSYPMEWENFLGELDKLLPMFGHEPDDPMPFFHQPIPESSAPEKPAEPASQSPGNDFPEQPLAILCIDDDPVVVQSIKIRLQPYRIKVEGANNGMQGYLAAVAKPPDLILLDLKMPNGEGGYVLTKLKDHEQTKNIPVIVLTVETHPGVRRQLLSVGAEAFLTKPVRWPELIDAMGRCIHLPEKLLADYHLEREMTLAEI